MKRTIVLLAVILAIFVITGCKSEPTEEHHEVTIQTSVNPYHLYNTEFEYTPSDDVPAEYPGGVSQLLGYLQYSGGYINLFVENMIYRYNPETGNVTALCADPVCMHNSKDCPFFGIDSTYCDIYDNKIYFRRIHYAHEGGKTLPVKEFVQYDIETLQMKIVEEISEGVRVDSRYYYGEYRYYLKTLVDDENNLMFELRRENMHTGEDILLKDTGNVPVGILYISDERIYLNEGGIIYYHDFNNLDEKKIVYSLSTRDGACDGEHYYAATRDETYTGKDGEGITTLVRFDMEGENLTTLSQANVGYVYLTEQYIYFQTKDQVSVGKRANGEDIMVDCSDIYRISKSGGEAELVYTLPDDMKHYLISNFIVVGNYLYAPYACYVPETQSLYESINGTPYDFLRINLTTGDIYYISEN